MDDQTPDEFMHLRIKATEEYRQFGRTIPYQKQLVRKNGSRWWSLMASARIIEDEGVGFIIDITEQKNLER